MKTVLNKFIVKLLCLIALLASFSCVQSPSSGNRSSLNSNNTEAGSGNGTGNGSTTPGDTGSDDDDVLVEPISSVIELNYFIDPYTGTPTSKLTLPKHFKGVLYITGNNLHMLKDSFVTVKFKFGTSKSVVSASAQIAEAVNGSIIPQTETRVMVLNFLTPPFQDMKLPYNLFDYNDYAASDTPTMDARDNGLYCRGVMLEDDPTHVGNTACNATDSQCLYAFAKINDSGLLDSTFNAIDPTSPQINSITGGPTYSEQPLAVTKFKCLPESAESTEIAKILGGEVPVDTNFAYSSPDGSGGMTDPITIGSDTYYYQGPYYASAVSGWQISGAAAFSSNNKGIYRSSITDNLTFDVQKGTDSMMFPLGGKTSLSSKVEYFGSSAWDGKKTLTYLSADGDSQFMNGCSIRMLNTNNDQATTNESISSCNVVGSIEVEATTLNSDGDMVTETISTTRSLKLQLIKPSNLDADGDEQVITNFKRCASSNECGGSECCFNERCWSKSIISQCVENSGGFMDGESASECNSDYDCKSLCCNNKKCAEHNPTENIYCSKASGSKCVAKEWCGVTKVQVCKTYRIGTFPNGNPECAVQCFPENRYGVCVASSGAGTGVCESPTPPETEITDCSVAPALP